MSETAPTSARTRSTTINTRTVPTNASIMLPWGLLTWVHSGVPFVGTVKLGGARVRPKGTTGLICESTMLLALGEFDFPLEGARGRTHVVWRAAARVRSGSMVLLRRGGTPMELDKDDG